jgi:hypothetical protein
MKMLPVESQYGGHGSRRQLSVATKRELIKAIAGGYHAALRADKKKIPDEFLEVSGCRRKHAIRVLRKVDGRASMTKPSGRR